MRKRSLSVTFGALMVAALTACAPSPEEADHTKVCVNPETMQRYEDDDCDDDGHSSGGRWFYGSSSHPRPAVGSRVDPGTGSFTKPSGSIATVSRGGFGGRAASGTS